MKHCLKIIGCALALAILLPHPGYAKWDGVEPWQNVKIGAPDTFLHLIVGNAIGALVQTRFPDDDRRTQFIKALAISLSLGLIKEGADMYNQYRAGKPLHFPDSMKDMSLNFLGVFLSFNFDFGVPIKKTERSALEEAICLEAPFEGAPLLEGKFALNR